MRGQAPRGSVVTRAPWVARWVALPGAVVAVSTAGVLIRLTTAPPLVTAANRLLLASGLLLAFALVKQRHDLRLAFQGGFLVLVACGILLGLHFALWTTSVFWTSVASAVFLVDTHPPLVAVAARQALGERTPPGVWLGIAVALLGSAIIAGGDFPLGERAVIGDAMALVASAAFAGYLVIGRAVRPRLGLAAYTGIVYGIAGLVVAVAAVASGTSLLTGVEHDLPLWLALVLVPTLGGHTVFNWTLRYVQASVVGASFFGDPVATTLLAWLVLGEPPPTSALLGGVVILSGLYLAWRSAS